MDDHRDIDIAFCSKDQVIKPFCIGVPVTRTADYGQTGVAKFDTGRNRDRPPMKRVKTVDIKIIGDFCMASDTRIPEQHHPAISLAVPSP